MTDNEKAAIAAGLWRCTSKDDYCGCVNVPDMHDPANLWEAFKRVAGELTFIPITDEAMFQALVSLYNAEHPGER